MIYDRKEQCLKAETEYRQGTVAFLYETVPGRVLLRLAVSPWFSKLWGVYQKSPLSRRKIRPFIQKYGVNMDELQGDYDRKALVAGRKQEQQQYENTPAYSRLVFAEKVINRPTFGGQGQFRNKLNTMTGIGTSAGKVTGRVLVIDQPDDQIDTIGKILVTRSTDPGWVFLLQRSIGIIAEKGSLLSHTAIISRELHKPAVVNVKDCTRLLRSGDLVELDADLGCITVIERCLTCEHI